MKKKTTPAQRAKRTRKRKARQAKSRPAVRLADGQVFRKVDGEWHWFRRVECDRCGEDDALVRDLADAGGVVFCARCFEELTREEPAPAEAVA